MHTDQAQIATNQGDTSDSTRVRGLDRARVQRRRAELEAEGFNASAWAEKNDFCPSTVYEIMSGRRACKRGISHNIAVLLGFKDGIVSPVGGAD